MKMSNFIQEHGKIAEINNTINPEYYKEHNLKRGLRNENGTGVKVGLTEISSVEGYNLEGGIKLPIDGELYYRGINLNDIVSAYNKNHRRGFEETIYLLLFGKLPNELELKDFIEVIASERDLPKSFTENMILKIPSKNIMNKLQRSILVLYSHDDNPEEIEINNVLKQCIKLIARFPTIISYGYQAKVHYFDNESLHIHCPQKHLGTAENILHLIRPDNKYTKTEAEILDLCLLVHADHGGGNNSAFATHVVSSSGTDTYSAIAAAVGCLKGTKHGGANIMVSDMIEDIKKNCDYSNISELKNYLKKIMDKDTFDKKGLIYGMGHAVYTYSDPRAVILKSKAIDLAIEKNMMEEYQLYSNIEKLTKELFIEKKGASAVICANVDLYSGFVYEMLNIPRELYTPLFATARIAGWCAHRIEQLMSDKKIIRPAYQNVSTKRLYIPIEKR